ncbi:MAG: hypothetical protein H5T86_05580 [Armatimonadetes bacterium]|nr:hypothetical protein [Armatimonadota bacterium]
MKTMRCPFCGGSFRLQGPFCPLCGRRVIGRDQPDIEQVEPARTPPRTHRRPPPTAGEDILVVEVEPEPTPTFPTRPRPASTPPPQPAVSPASATPVGQEFLGRICPYCRFPLKQGERMIVCPACKVGHHADCWNENGGCTTYGCQYSPQAHPVSAGTPTATPGAAPSPSLPRPPGWSPGTPLPPPAAVAAAARLEADATNALVLSLLGLFCLGILSIIGMMMGIGVLARMRAIGLDVPGARSKATAAVIIGASVIGLMLAIIVLTAKSAGSLGPAGYF